MPLGASPVPDALWQELAPAKLNLALHVGAPRADGYHPLWSIVAFADVGDRLRYTPSDHLHLSVEGPFAGALADEDPNTNLVLRAAQALAAELGHKATGQLHLHKALPVAAGLGGGSADAAAALRLLNRAWGAQLSLTALAEIAKPLGADVPVCVQGQGALMTGIGHDLRPMDLLSFPAVLVNPLRPCSTGAVYRVFDEKAQFAKDLDRKIEGDCDGEVLTHTRNDLLAAACAVCPEINDVLTVVTAHPGTRLARLSGSGATVWVMMESREQAEDLVNAIHTHHLHWWAVATQVGARPADTGI